MIAKRDIIIRQKYVPGYCFETLCYFKLKIDLGKAKDE